MVFVPSVMVPAVAIAMIVLVAMIAVMVVVPQLVDVPTGVIATLLEITAFLPVHLAVAPVMPLGLGDLALFVVQLAGFITGQIAFADAVFDAGLLAILTVTVTPVAVVISGQNRQRQHAQQGCQPEYFGCLHDQLLLKTRETLPLLRQSRGAN
ncbi:MAG: hypothetical protein RLZ44_944 [Pseudomonadota bacterium]